MKGSIIKMAKNDPASFSLSSTKSYVSIAVLSTAPFKQVILILPVASIILKEAHMSTYW